MKFPNENPIQQSEGSKENEQNLIQAISSAFGTVDRTRAVIVAHQGSIVMSPRTMWQGILDLDFLDPLICKTLIINPLVFSQPIAMAMSFQKSFVLKTKHLQAHFNIHY